MASITPGDANDVVSKYFDGGPVCNSHVVVEQLTPLAAAVTARSAAAASRQDNGKSGPGFFMRVSFQRLVLFAVARLSIYIFKLFEDGYSVKEYKNQSDINFMLISAAGLVVPPVFYAIFLMGQNLTKDDILDTNELGTKAVNGLLLIPWQIKRHLDVLHFAAQRVCQWRQPTKDEQQDLQTIQRNAEILEFFEDIYAGFLQILLQLYIFLEFQGPKNDNMKFIQNQLIASVLSVLSMLIAVRRRDDGPLTGFLSFFGWSFVITSRIFVFSLVSTKIGGFLVLLLLVHVIAISVWVYNIAIESYKTSSPSEAAQELTNQRKKGSIAVMVALFFGIPSLLIWPIMFQLKQKKRPFIFLAIIVVENLLLLGVWFMGSGVTLGADPYLIVGIIGGTTVAGVLFLSLYTCCKPKLTDQVVLHDIREATAQDAPSILRLNAINARAFNATQYGIYYEFCDLVFNLPSTHKLASDLQEIRNFTARLDNETSAPVVVSP